MRPHEVAASVEPAQWEMILAAVREHNPALWRDLERAACQDQRIPPRLWQRYGPADRRALVRRALGAPASGPLTLDVLREYLLAEQRPLVIRFLDLAGVPHEEGVLLEGPVPEPETATLDAAIDTLLAEEPRPMALLYLRALSAQDNVEWPRLEARLAAEAQAPQPEPPGGGTPPTSPAAPPAGATAATTAPPARDMATRPGASAPAAEPGPSARADAAPTDTAPPDVTGHAAIAPAPPRAPGPPSAPSNSLAPSPHAAHGAPADGGATSAAGDAGRHPAASGIGEVALAAGSAPGRSAGEPQGGLSPAADAPGSPAATATVAPPPPASSAPPANG